MKKRLLLLLSLLLLTGCSSGVSQDEYDAVKKERDDYKEKYEALLEGDEEEVADLEEEDADDADDEASADKPSSQKTNSGDVNGEDVIEQLEVTDYTWSSKTGRNYIALVIKNNSEPPLKLKADLLMYDGDKNIVATKNDSLYAFEAGQEMVMTFSNEEDYDSYEYSFTADADKRYEPVLSSLEHSINESEKKLVVSVTNNGDITADYVNFTVLYFRGDDVVDYSNNYIGSPSDIEPGDTKHKETSKTKQDYDSYKIYFASRGK